MHNFFTPESFQHILPIQQAEAIQLLNDSLDDPLVISLFSIMPYYLSETHLSEYIYAY